MANEDRFKELLEQAKAHIKALEEEIQRLTAPPLTLTTVCQQIVEGEKVMLLVSTQQGPLLIPAPDDKKLLKKMKPGAMATVGPTGAVLEVFEHPLPGIEVTVKRVFDESNMIELDGGLGNGGAVVFRGHALEKIRPGDVVLLDRTGQVALRKVKKDRTAYSVETATGVKWDDIGGQEEAKRVLREVLEEPITHADLHSGYGKHP